MLRRWLLRESWENSSSVHQPAAEPFLRAPCARHHGNGWALLKNNQVQDESVRWHQERLLSRQTSRSCTCFSSCSLSSFVYLLHPPPLFSSSYSFSLSAPLIFSHCFSCSSFCSSFFCSSFLSSLFAYSFSSSSPVPPPIPSFPHVLLLFPLLFLLLLFPPPPLLPSSSPGWVFLLHPCSRRRWRTPSSTHRLSFSLFTSSIRQLIHRRDYMLLIKQLIS